MKRSIWILLGAVIVVMIGLYIGITALYHQPLTSQWIEKTGSTPQ